MSAQRIADLANMALAEIGSPGVVVSKATPERPNAVAGMGGDEEVTRAVMLAKLRVQGPHEQTTCRKHHWFGLTDRCARVSVAEALLGVVCGAP